MAKTNCLLTNLHDYSFWVDLVIYFYLICIYNFMNRSCIEWDLNTTRLVYFIFIDTVGLNYGVDSMMIAP